MSVEMDRVRYGRRSVFLDNPVGPYARCGQLDQVFGCGVAGVALLHVGQGRLFPVYVDRREVDTPHDEILLVGDHGGVSNADGEGRGLYVEGGGGYGVGKIRYER